MAAKEKKLTTKTIGNNFRLAYKYWRPIHEAAVQDFQYLLGYQWEDKDLQYMEKIAVPALTINKIQPLIFLASGIQRQNRSDFLAYPEGSEDSLVSDIVTRLLKNAMKKCQGEYKASECFEDGITGGFGYLEPFIDYTYDLVTGQMRIAKRDPFEVYPQPGFKEYDLSDCEHVFVFTPNLTKDQLIQMFPEKESEIDKLENGKFEIESISGGKARKENDGGYENPDKKGQEADDSEWLGKTAKYDLTGYYYKKYVKKYLVVDVQAGQMKEAASLEEAKRYEEHFNTLSMAQYQERLQAYELQQQGLHTMPDGTVMANEDMPGAAGQSPEVPGAVPGQPGAIPPAPPLPGQEQPPVEHPGEYQGSGVKVITRMVPEIWLAYMVGEETILEDKQSWSYPKYKGFPVVPFFAHWTTTNAKKRTNNIQGIVRSLKDPQREYNKRRSQELRIINTTANSGFYVEEGSLVNPEIVKEFGGSPGIMITYKKGSTKPEKIQANGVPMGIVHAGQENVSDLKEISGINADLLSMQEGGADSGRAIMLRQKQGMVMVQRIFDNWSQSQRILGRFLLSQLGEIYTVETAIRTLGDAFIRESFEEPIMAQDPATGETVPQMDSGGNLVKQLDKAKVGDVINKILNDTELGKYDVAIGEGQQTETVKAANYLMLMDLVGKGMPIPPDVLIDESSLSESAKIKIKTSIQQAQAQAAAAAQQPAAPPAKK